MATVIKLALGGECHRIPATTAPTIAALRAAATATYASAGDPKFTYVDADGDVISLATDSELASALAEASGTALKITIAVAASGALSRARATFPAHCGLRAARMCMR